MPVGTLQILYCQVPALFCHNLFIVHYFRHSIHYLQNSSKGLPLNTNGLFTDFYVNTQNTLREENIAKRIFADFFVAVVTIYDLPKKLFRRIVEICDFKIKHNKKGYDLPNFLLQNQLYRVMNHKYLKERNCLWNKFFADFCDSVPVPYKIGFADGNFANRIHFHYVLF